MTFPNRNIVERLRRQYPTGTLIVLDEMDDSQAPKPGTLGRVCWVDDAGNINVQWFGGGSLNVVYGVDRCHIASEDELKAHLMKISAKQKDGDRCPRCGAVMEGRLHTHALSWRADIIICDRCGSMEAVEDFTRNKLPLSDWAALREAWT